MTAITRGLDAMNERKVELIYQLLMDNDLTALHAQARPLQNFVFHPSIGFNIRSRGSLSTDR